MVDDAGLRGMVALMKMRESRLRWCVVTSVLVGDFSNAHEYGDGVWESCEEKDVWSGDSICIWRIARGELGRPQGDRGGGREDIVLVGSGSGSLQPVPRRRAVFVRY